SAVLILDKVGKERYTLSKSKDFQNLAKNPGIVPLAPIINPPTSSDQETLFTACLSTLQSSLHSAIVCTNTKMNIGDFFCEDVNKSVMLSVFVEISDSVIDTFRACELHRFASTFQVSVRDRRLLTTKYPEYDFLRKGSKVLDSYRY
ncbi:hypothetical protein L9F63_004608, partial [Diploptera punctata]